MTDEGGDTRHVIGYSQDAAKHSTMHKIAPATKNYPILNVNHFAVEADVNIGILAGGAGSSYDLTSVISDGHLVVQDW